MPFCFVQHTTIDAQTTSKQCTCQAKSPSSAVNQRIRSKQITTFTPIGTTRKTHKQVLKTHKLLQTVTTQNIGPVAITNEPQTRSPMRMTKAMTTTQCKRHKRNSPTIKLNRCESVRLATTETRRCQKSTQSENQLKCHQSAICSVGYQGLVGRNNERN